jgi:holo-[acyl-carrier protein] synthase
VTSLQQPGDRGSGSRLLGIGLDSVDVARFGQVLARRPALAERLFTPREREYAFGMLNPVPALAGRFAAKEAVMKALGVGLGAFAWKEAEVQRKPGGAPSLLLRGRAAELAAVQGVSSWKLSITHTAQVATAVAVALS